MSYLTWHTCIQRCQPLDTKNQTEYPKKSDFREKNQNFTKTQRLSHLLQGRIVALLPILQNSRPRRHIQLFVCIAGFTFTWFYAITRLLLSLRRFLFCSVFYLLVFKRQYRSTVFPSFYCTKYDKILNMIKSYWLASLLPLFLPNQIYPLPTVSIWLWSKITSYIYVHVQDMQTCVSTTEGRRLGRSKDNISMGLLSLYPWCIVVAPTIWIHHLTLTSSVVKWLRHLH